MPLTTRRRATGIALAALVASLVTIGTTAPARAAGYDVDCKLILCLPAGFPSGCRDAYRRLIDRLQDGKSPIGFCARSDGSELRTDVAWNRIRATTSSGWDCPAGKSLYHRFRYDSESRTSIVNTFCYDTRIRSGTDWRTGLPRYYYTGKSLPERTDLAVSLTVSPGTREEYATGVRKFDANVVSDAGIRVHYDE